MLTWKQILCCLLNTPCACGAGARDQGAAPACPVGPTPTLRSRTLNMRTQRLVSASPSLLVTEIAKTMVLIILLISLSIPGAPGEADEKLLCPQWAKVRAFCNVT